MRKCQPIFMLLFLTACASTKSLQWEERSKLAGEWEIACSGPIDQPEKLDCPEVQGKQLITLDEQGNSGQFTFDLCVQTIRQSFELYHEGKKVMIFYVDPQGNESRGEIITLNKNNLIIHYDKEGIRTVQKRR